jgi:hypothetical protein
VFIYEHTDTRQGLADVVRQSTGLFLVFFVGTVLLSLFILMSVPAL